MKAVLLQAVALSALAAIASAQVPAGAEFRVNTYTTGSQVLARVGMGPQGDFVIVWPSYVQGGTANGAFGRRFTASGVPQGDEFQINSYTTGFQGQPHCAVGSKGDFVVVWVSVQGDADLGILGRRFDASGTAVGAEFPINTYTTGAVQYRPSIGRASDGRFTVSWTSADAAGKDIAARRFDASGNAIGSEFVVNTYTTGDQIYGEIAVEPNGVFVIVWEDYLGNRDGSGSAIFGQRFDAAGDALGSEFQVNTWTTGDQTYPSVSASPAGGFVVVWTSEYGDGNWFGMFSRRFDASGNPLGSDFVVNTYTTGFQYGVLGQVAHDLRGNFIVSWHGSGNGNGTDSFAQRFNASGSRRGGEFRINTYTTGAQRAATVDSDSVGNFVIAWHGQDGSDYGIYAQRFGGLRPTGLRVDTPGNGVLEPGDVRDVRPTWENINGAAQTFTATIGSPSGPAGGIPQILDSVGVYGTVPNGASAECSTCYTVSIQNPSPRPSVHWDGAVVETIVPDAQGQQKQWLLHVGGSFTDVPASGPFYRFVETLLHHSVTGGCSPTQYCPASSTTREQMAVFVLVAKEGAGYVPPACTTPMFADVPASSPFCRWIEELARRAVVTGCGGGNYCPSNAVTRDQMAVFVLRTLDPTLSPPACAPPNTYDDVSETNPFCPWIEELTRRGVVTGCGNGNYCPAAPVTREQMGVFISATFGLTLYGP